MAQSVKPAAVLGGNRIPFARSGKAYAQASNQDMLTATLDGLVARFGLQGEQLGEVVAGAVLKHARDFNLTRESVLGSALSPATPAYDIQQACDTGIEAAVLVANKIALGQIDVGVAGGTDTTSDAPLGVNDDLRRIMMKANNTKSTAERAKLLTQLRPGHIVPDMPRNAEPRTGPVDGRAHRADRRALGDHARGAGRADGGQPPEPRRRLRPRLLRRPRHPVPRPRARRDIAPRLLRGQAGQAQAGLRRQRQRDDDGGQLDAPVGRRLGRAAVQRRVGGGALPAGARAPDPRRDRSRRLRARRRGAADGARLRRGQDARQGGPLAAGLRLLRDPRGLRRTGPVHAEGLGGPLLLRRAPRPRRAAGIDRPGQAQRERLLAGRGPPVRRHRRPHHRHRGQAPRREGLGPRARSPSARRAARA